MVQPDLRQRRMLRELARERSLGLLATVSLGRVVFTDRALPAIRPVNHLVDRERVIIRSHVGAAILSAAQQQAVVAYEADEIDPVDHRGWSVVVTGVARLVRDPEAIRRYREVLRPWIDRRMDQFIAISADIVTGFELVAPTGPAPVQAPLSS